MRVLSLTQPWATLVVHGEKQYETRSWRSWYTGPLLIHASKAYPGWAKQLEKEEPFRTALRDFIGNYRYPELECGHIIGKVDLTACVRTEFMRGSLSDKEIAFGDYADGRWAWRLTNPQRLLEPIAVKGSLGLWEFNEVPLSEADWWPATDCSPRHEQTDGG